MSRSRQIGVFLAITFVASWSIAATFFALGRPWEGALAQAVGMLFMMPPAFAALIVKGPMARAPVLEHLGLSLRPNRWWLVSWLIPPFIVMVTLGLSHLMPGATVAFGVEPFLDHWRELVPAEHFEQFEGEVRDGGGMDPLLRMGLQAMVAGVTINAIVALGEELGWRGLLHHDIRLGFWRKSAVIGAIWGLWHAPLIALGHNYPEHPGLGVPMMILWTVAVSPIFAYVRERSGSVVAAGILHGTLNALAGIPLIATRGGSDLLTGLTGLAGLAAIGLVVGLLWVHDRHVAEERVMTASPAPMAGPSPDPEPGSEPARTDPSPPEGP